nr:aminotransferase class I/II-fold pyridoxal phosphate-dependent enzyme [Haemophilus parahaemolyticus]
MVDVIRNLPTAQGYCDSKGLYSARKAIVQYYQSKCMRGMDVNDVYIGNGVSELITMSMQALLNEGDEILIPMPDYPLWTAAATLAVGRQCITFAMKRMSGSLILKTLKRRLAHAPKGF